jgi:hypothetical protein
VIDSSFTTCSTRVVVVVLVVVLLVIVQFRALVCAGVVIATFVDVLTVDIRVDVLIIVSNLTVDLLMDALTDIIRDVLSNIDVDVLADVNVNVFAGVMTAFEFATSGPLEEFRR